MKAGKYYIGDLCYILNDEDYDEIVCTFKYDGEEQNDVKGHTFFWNSTAWGDGCYQDQSGNNYSVDAGLIGCIIIKDEGMLQKAQELVSEGHANLVEFEHDFECHYENGTFYFGHIVIHTDEDEEEEDECWC